MELGYLMNAHAFKTDLNLTDNNHWMLALPLTAWVLFWLAFNSRLYFPLIWRIFSTLGWLGLAVIISPSFWIWLACFSLSIWVPFLLTWRLWEKNGEPLSLMQMFWGFIIIPMLLGLALVYIGPYFYPLLHSGNHFSIRFIPILGGKGAI